MKPLTFWQTVGASMVGGLIFAVVWGGISVAIGASLPRQAAQNTPPGGQR